MILTSTTTLSLTGCSGDLSDTMPDVVSESESESEIEDGNEAESEGVSEAESEAESESENWSACEEPAKQLDGRLTACLFWRGQSDLDLRVKRREDGCNWSEGVSFTNSAPDWCVEGNNSDDPRLLWDAIGGCEDINSECVHLDGLCFGSYDLAAQVFGSPRDNAIPSWLKLYAHEKGMESHIQQTPEVSLGQNGETFWLIGAVSILGFQTPLSTAPTCENGNPSKEVLCPGQDTCAKK